MEFTDIWIFKTAASWKPHLIVPPSKTKTSTITGWQADPFIEDSVDISRFLRFANKPVYCDSCSRVHHSSEWITSMDASYGGCDACSAKGWSHPHCPFCTTNVPNLFCNCTEPHEIGIHCPNLPAIDGRENGRHRLPGNIWTPSDELSTKHAFENAGDGLNAIFPLPATDGLLRWNEGGQVILPTLSISEKITPNHRLVLDEQGLDKRIMGFDVQHLVNINLENREEVGTLKDKIKNFFKERVKKPDFDGENHIWHDVAFDFGDTQGNWSHQYANNREGLAFRPTVDRRIDGLLTTIQQNLDRIERNY